MCVKIKEKERKLKRKLRLLVQSQAKKKQHSVRVPFTKRRMFALRSIFKSHDVVENTKYTVNTQRSSKRKEKKCLLLQNCKSKDSFLTS